MSQLWRVAWYRFRLDARRRWPTYAALIALIALVGGVSLGSIAGARRTESAYPTFLKSTNPSDMAIDVGMYNPKIISEIARLPQVTSIESYVSPTVAPVTRAGFVIPNTPEITTSFDPLASLNGLYFDQDRFTILQGKMPDPRRADEAMVNPFAAQLLGLHVGQVIRFGFFANAQLGQNGLPTTPSTRIFDIRITGIGVGNDEIVQDEIDRLPLMVLTPALTRTLVPCCISFAWSGVRLRHGAADVAKVESEYLHLLPPGYPYYFHVTSVVENQAEQAVKPEAIALAVFGLIAGLAALIIAFQVIGRLVLETADAREVMWYVGASPRNTSTDSLLGVGISLLVGALAAAGVAAGLSPLLIVGPVRTLLGISGFSFDWSVLGLGALALFAVLMTAAALLNYRNAPGLRRARLRVPRRSSFMARTVSGMPAPAGLGVHYALEGGKGRASVPVRSSILASVLAVVVVVGTLTFGSSLNTLVATPKLFGWNWSAMLESNSGYGNVPLAQATRLLDHDPTVAAWSGVDFDSLLFNGQAVPVVGATLHAPIAPALLAGHEVDEADQVVLGPQTLDQLHLHLGDTVRVTGGRRPTRLHIVGVATMPTVGIGFGLHLSIGSGAFLDYRVLPPDVLNITGLPDPGPNAILVRFTAGADPAVARRALSKVVGSLNALEGGAASIHTYGDIRPAEITNYQAMGSTPLLLAGGLAIGAVVGLALTLLTSVRRRRRELALLKALGFTRRQLASVVAWQSTVSVALGIVVGVPVGIAFGRAMWNLFAHELFAIPDATVPALAIGLVALGALILANVVAALPGRRAAATPTGVILRAE